MLVRYVRMALTPEQAERVRYLAEDEWGSSSEDEAAQWANFDHVLGEMSAEELHAFVDRMNWDGGGADRLTRVLAHPLCDRGTALIIYWRARPTFYIKYGTRERVRDKLWPSALADYDMLRDIEQRFQAGDFTTANIPYDPANDGGGDRTGRGQALPPIMFEPIRGSECGT
jgi:hypothetical protein